MKISNIWNVKNEMQNRAELKYDEYTPEKQSQDAIYLK